MFDALTLTLQGSTLGSEHDQGVGLLLPGRHKPIARPTLFPRERHGADGTPPAGRFLDGSVDLRRPAVDIGNDVLLLRDPGVKLAQLLDDVRARRHSEAYVRLDTGQTDARGTGR